MKKKPWLFGNTTMRNPLRIHDVMAALKKNSGSSSITFSEMAGIVQFRNSEANMKEVCNERLNQRKSRGKSKNNHKFDLNFISEYAQLYGYATGTPGDYADTNFRYLKATGLFCAHEHGIALVPHRECLAELLAETFEMPVTDDRYLDLISNGAALPVDDKQTAWQEWVGLSQRITENGIDLKIHLTADSDVKDIRHTCYRADAFLAVNSLLNHPHQARRFPVDVDFRPVSTAPGNGPDMIFEFKG